MSDAIINCKNIRSFCFVFFFFLNFFIAVTNRSKKKIISQMDDVMICRLYRWRPKTMNRIKAICYWIQNKKKKIKQSKCSPNGGWHHHAFVHCSHHHKMIHLITSYAICQMLYNASEYNALQSYHGHERTIETLGTNNAWI